MKSYIGLYLFTFICVEFIQHSSRVETHELTGSIADLSMIGIVTANVLLQELEQRRPLPTRQVMLGNSSYQLCYGLLYQLPEIITHMARPHNEETHDLNVASSTPSWGAIKSTRSTQPSIPPG